MRGARAIQGIRVAVAGVARWPWAEVLAALLLVAGWALVTWGVVLFTTPKVWALSTGIFLLSLFGWRFLYVIAREGLYRLTRDGRQ